MANESQLTQTIQNWSRVFMRHSFHEFKQFMDINGLSPSQVLTLLRLYHSGPCSVSMISSQLGVTNAASSQLIDRLVLQGLIERSEDVSDRRVKHLSITERGRNLLEEGINVRRLWMETLTTQLTSDQQAIIVAALTVLTDCASKIEDE
jgi:DNA-binding MarR family transcriptional regulator